MTKKQLKQLARTLADCEIIIQTSTDQSARSLAEKKVMKLQESANLSLDEMVALDELIKTYLSEKNI